MTNQFAVEQKIIFGIQGGPGSFNDEAIQHYILQQGITTYQIDYLYTSERVMNALHQQAIHYGQCAIYNSIGGFVSETTQAIQRWPVQEVTTFEITIAHAMMIHPQARLEEITTLMAHPQVFAQCQNSLIQKYPHLLQVSGDGDLIDNAKAAEALAEGTLPKHIAVLGSRKLADLYHLKRIDQDLQDSENNLTRFIIVESAATRLN